MPRSTTARAVASAALLSTFLLGVLVAHAMMGTPGGATRSVLTFAGTLTDTSGAPIKMPQTLKFEFANPKNQTCPVAGLAVTPDPNTGAFTVDIPIDQCTGGAAFFDGSDITYTITVGTTVVTSTPPPTISPVPYAKYADVAANAAPGSALEGKFTAIDGSLAALPAIMAQVASLQGVFVQQSAGPQTVTNGFNNWVDIPGLSATFTNTQQGALAVQATVGIGGSAQDANAGWAWCGVRILLDNAVPTVGGQQSVNDGSAYVGPSHNGQLQGPASIVTIPVLAVVDAVAPGPHTVKMQMARIAAGGDMPDCQVGNGGAIATPSRMFIQPPY